MRIVLQRVKKAQVEVAGNVIGAIDAGVMLLVGVTHSDTEKDVQYLADKVANLRIFNDPDGKMNLSVTDVGGEVLSISQFTLYGDTRKGRRPSFVDAAKPDVAADLYEKFNQVLKQRHQLVVETGEFGADMAVSLVNDGPVTIILES